MLFVNCEQWLKLRKKCYNLRLSQIVFGTELKLNTCLIFFLSLMTLLIMFAHVAYGQHLLFLWPLKYVCYIALIDVLNICISYLIDCVSTFSGVQRQLTYDMVHNDDPSSVQGLIEYALKQLQPLNIPKLHLSSRLVNILIY